MSYRVITDIKRGQLAYERSMLAGHSHDEAFSYAAYKASQERLRPYEDGDTISFIRLNPYANKITDDFGIQMRYWQMRRDGQSHRMAEMLATRKFPGLKTDSIFNEGRCNGNQFERIPQEGDYLRGIAEEAGVNTTGKVYLRGLADYPGDPTAWISDRGDVLRVAREKGYKVDGYVNYQPPEAEPMADVDGVAPELIEDEVQTILASNPGARADDVREHITDLRSGRVDPNPLVLQE